MLIEQNSIILILQLTQLLSHCILPCLDYEKAIMSLWALRRLLDSIVTYITCLCQEFTRSFMIYNQSFLGCEFAVRECSAVDILHWTVVFVHNEILIFKVVQAELATDKSSKSIPASNLMVLQVRDKEIFFTVWALSKVESTFRFVFFDLQHWEDLRTSQEKVLASELETLSLNS
jgi:hypothetical protein